MNETKDDVINIETTEKESANIKTKADNEVFCSHCGAIISEKAEICPKCGVRQKESFSSATNAASQALTRQTASGRNKWIAIIIALFLGGFGGHKFYLGKTGTGIVYLLFCWTFIPAILTIIDIIVLLTKSDEEFERLYG